MHAVEHDIPLHVALQSTLENIQSASFRKHYNIQSTLGNIRSILGNVRMRSGSPSLRSSEADSQLTEPPCGYFCTPNNNNNNNKHAYVSTTE
jgi:hypothetical protein